eukprot:scaffold28807_cov67-Phaeocystis_antarctica.AAC.9
MAHSSSTSSLWPAVGSREQETRQLRARSASLSASTSAGTAVRVGKGCRGVQLRERCFPRGLVHVADHVIEPEVAQLVGLRRDLLGVEALVVDRDRAKQGDTSTGGVMVGVELVDGDATREGARPVLLEPVDADRVSGRGAIDEAADSARVRVDVPGEHAPLTRLHHALLTVGNDVRRAVGDRHATVDQAQRDRHRHLRCA